MVHFFAACRSARNSNFSAASSLGNPPRVLALFQRPVPTGALFVGVGVAQFKMMDATEDLIADGVVQRLFDADQNEYSYTHLGAESFQQVLSCP
jgi:hypothetical protein